MIKIEEDNIKVSQKEQQGYNQVGICKYLTKKDLRNLFEKYVILKYFEIESPDGFNPENAKKGLWIQKVQLTEGIEVNETLPDLYSLIEDSKLETPRTKKTIGDSLLKSLENCLSLNNNEHETPKNLVDKQFPDETYIPTSEPKKENYLSIRYIIPEIEKKIKTIKELVKNLDVKNPKIDQLLYKLAKSKPS
ncbi:MAG: hypothetical protein KJ968_05855 [Nanoarchaeota archaeon]|nr:hypothetical protein [Nanoarchaeota archaeon]